MVMSITARMVPNHSGAMAEPSEDETPLQRRFGDLTFYLVGVGTVALIATCIRVWAGMDVIQTQINSLAKSDSKQDNTIEMVRTEVNALRVQVGIMRETMRLQHHGVRP